MTATHPSGGPDELRAVTLKECRRLLLQAGAVLLHGRREDTLECMLDDAVAHDTARLTNGSWRAPFGSDRAGASRDP